ncbi:MAG: replication protein DnaC [Firmicutes bacterium]|nr:replication protein DnaC [Bacillota bacterium]
MSYSEAVLRRATARLEERRLRRQEGLASLKKSLYRDAPRVAELDRRLRETLPRVISAAFRKGEDPGEALAALREQNQALQEERLRLLREAGYRPEELEDRPVCPLCNDTGWRGASMCRCLRALCAEEQIRELSSTLNMGMQSFSRFRLDYYEDTLWPAYGRSPRQNMEKVLAVCRRFAQKPGQDGLRNLFFYGGTGLGKTFLSAAIAREVSEGGRSVVYDTAGGIFARFEEQKFSRDTDNIREARDLTRKYLNCDLLIVDDLGSELTTPFVQSALYQLVNTRLAEERCTIISSNFSIDELRRRYTPQIISRLEGEYEPLPFFGQDIRLLRQV